MRTFLFVLFTLSLPLHLLSGERVSKDYSAMSGAAVRQAERVIFEKYGLQATAMGGGAMTVVDKVTLGVESNKPMSLEEGRRLLIACSKILLQSINEMRPLRPYLFEYPFPVDRISFYVYISPEAEKQLPKNAPTIFSLMKGKIRFYNCPDSFDTPASLEPLHVETYQEALEILAKEDKKQPILQKANCEKATPASEEIITKDEPLSAVSKFVKEGETAYSSPRYYGPDEEREMYWHLDGYANGLAKKYEMEFHKVGNFSDNRDAIYGLTFINFHQMTLMQGKEFARMLVKDFLRELRTSPEVKRQVLYRKDSYKNTKYPPLITDEPVPEQMGLKIGFWDKNFDRPKKPYLAEIVFLHGDFYYYEANAETQSCELVLKESYQDVFGTN